MRCATMAFAAVCALLAAAAEDAARHPPLRTLLEQRLGGFAIEGLDVPRHETPVVIEGTLAADAAVTDSGALLRLRVERVWLGLCPEAAPGGASLTVTGVLAADAVGEWRAGRRIKAPALLRRPARYLNAGVPDQERLLARRGVSLVGSIKSAALVEVISRGHWFDETAGAIRSAVRQAMARHVAVRDPRSAAVATAILIGDRGGLEVDVERRLQEAGTYHVIAISGGNIAILAGLILGALWWLRIRDGWAAGAAVGGATLLRRNRAVAAVAAERSRRTDAARAARRALAASLADAGRHTLIAFSARDCALCAAMQPTLAGVAEKEAAWLDVVSVDADDGGAWAPETLHYDIQAVPSYILLDDKGRAVAGARGRPADAGAAAAAVDFMVAAARGANKRYR